MKYSTEIEIKRPREEVVKKFLNPENKKHWQQHLISLETLSGTPGEEGAKTNLKYKIEDHEVELTETLQQLNFPVELRTIYEAKNLHYLQDNFFEDTPQNTTRWIAHHEYKFSGTSKLKSIFRPDLIRKQSYQDTENFKNFIENASKPE